MHQIERDLNQILKSLAEIIYDQYVKELKDERSIRDPNLKIFDKNK
jgi:hypothetical protein